MLLNGYTILSLFLCGIRLLIGLTATGRLLWLRKVSAPGAALLNRSKLEDNSYLLFLMMGTLLALNTFSWLFLYMLLQSYVSEWGSVMCIYGVLQIGHGSSGVDAYLPGVAVALQWSKPILVFISGVALSLYAVNRKSVTAPLTTKILNTLMLLGFVTVLDAVLEAAFVVIPRADTLPAASCCSARVDAIGQTSRSIAIGFVDDSMHTFVTCLYVLSNLGIILTLFWAVLHTSAVKWRAAMRFIFLGAVASLPINVLFLVDVAAPSILSLPFHHCPYDLIGFAPESVPGVALFVLGAFFVGWGTITVELGRMEETSLILPGFAARMLFAAMICYTCSLTILLVEWGFA